MKKLVYLLSILFICLQSCSKDDEPQLPGNVEITVSYFYNDYLGYKPDVGATAYLFESKYSSIILKDSMQVVLARVGWLADKNGDLLQDKYLYNQEADLSGKIIFKDLLVGDYFLLLSSKGRWTYSTKVITIESAKTLSLVKNFNYLDEFEAEGEYW